MRILSFSSCFPHPANPTQGIFVLRRLAAIGRLETLEVVHPYAVVPLLGSVRGSRPPGYQRLEGLSVHHLPFGYAPGFLKRFDGHFYGRGLLKWVRSYIARCRPDLLDAHFMWPDGVGVAYLAGEVGLPYSITLRGTIQPRYKIQCFRKRITPALLGASAVICVSQPLADIALELGVPAGRLHVIPNAVDGESFAMLPRQLARQKLQLPADGPLVVCVAALKPQKGQHDLIEAFAAIEPPARLVLVGPQTDFGGYYRQLTALVRHNGLDARVTFAGNVPQSHVADYLNAADLAVLPSHSEGCPNVLLESLSCGTPVVAANVGGVGQIVQDGRNGLLVPPSDPTVLAQAIRLALDRQWDRHELRQTVADRSWDSVARQVTDVFRRIISAPTSQRTLVP